MAAITGKVLQSQPTKGDGQAISRVDAMIANPREMGMSSWAPIEEHNRIE